MFLRRVVFHKCQFSANDVLNLKLLNVLDLLTVFYSNSLVGKCYVPHKALNKFVFHGIYVMCHIWGSDPANNKKRYMINEYHNAQKLKYRSKQP